MEQMSLKLNELNSQLTVKNKTISQLQLVLCWLGNSLSLFVSLTFMAHYFFSVSCGTNSDNRLSVMCLCEPVYLYVCPSLTHSKRICQASVFALESNLSYLISLVLPYMAGSHVVSHNAEAT